MRRDGMCCDVATERTDGAAKWCEAAAEKQQEECANVEIEKIHNAQEEPEKQELIEYDQEILDGMIREVRQKLYIMKEYWIKSQPQYYTKHRMMLRAYELLMKAGS